MKKGLFTVTLIIWAIAVVVVKTTPILNASVLGVILGVSCVIQSHILSNKSRPLLDMLVFQSIWGVLIVLLTDKLDYRGIALMNIMVFQIPAFILIIAGIFKRK